MEKIADFFKRIFSHSSENTAQIEETSVSELEEMLIEVEKSAEENKIKAAKSSLTTKLYSLEQDIAIFELDFPEKHKYFSEKINSLRDEYLTRLENFSEDLTFEIDPELDGIIRAEVSKLGKEIKRFVETEVQFNIIFKRLQRLITKLNILYNVSIFHSKNDERKKVSSQLENALNVESQLAEDLKECRYLLNDMRSKESIQNLFSYLDYQIFKTFMRVSDETPEAIIEKLVMQKQFSDFAFENAFDDFVKDEILNLKELTSLVTDQHCRIVLQKEISNFHSSLTYSDDIKEQFLDVAFWNTFFSIESSLFEILKSCGVDKDEIKVEIPDRLQINVDESEVLVYHKTTALISLTKLFSKVRDERILVLLKLLRNISNDVTYKEIYFLLIVFDGIEVVKNNHNDFYKHIEKYLNKYPYSQKTIAMRKEQLQNSFNKEYVYTFSVRDDETDIVLKTLERLNIDFNLVEDKVFINSFYFKDLENVISSLQQNTINITA